MAGVLTSVGGILALLDDTDVTVQTFALRKLDSLVDQFWAEISDVVQKIEILYEDDGFPERELAALVVSKVYFHLGAYDESMAFALNAGGAFDIHGTTQYITTIVSQCIDKYTALRQRNHAAAAADSPAADSPAAIDAKLEAVVDRMFARCFAAGEFEQAAGIALESHRLDMLGHAIAAAPAAEAMLQYVYDIAQTLLPNRKFRGQVLRMLAPLYAALPVPGFVPMSQIHVFLDDDAAAASLLQTVVARGDLALALQLAFDFVDAAPQHFLLRVRAHLQAAAAAASSPAAGELRTLADVLTGELTQRLAVDFLGRSNNADLLILQTTRKALPPNNSVLHSALVLANAAMYAGTASDAFLRDDPKWVLQAAHWAKFGIVSSLGVIHKGHTAEAMNVAAPYLAKGSLPAAGAAGAPAAGGSGGSSNPFEIGGGLYALGLVAAGHGGSVTEYLAQQLEAPGAAEPVQHGNCLGLGLAAMGSADAAHFDRLKGVLFADNAVAGEAAGLGMGLVMLGSADAAAVAVMLQYAQETAHEKIIRGLALGIALVMYNAQEGADALIAQLATDKDALLRMAGAHTLALAYVGTGDNTAIARLLHMSVSDVSDDVRRVAVAALGFVLCRSPAQVPSVVSLLSESYNPHVRHGACMALAVACANTGSAEALALLEPMLSDTANFVRQGAYIASAMVMMQQPNSHPKAASTRAQLAKVATSTGQDLLAKFGAVYAQGLLECGGRNVTVSLVREGSHVSMPAAVGLLVWTQMWFWFPYAHFLSLATTPSALIAVDKDLKMPVLSFRSNAAPSVFAYPPKTEPPKAEVKNKVETAVLSITAKQKAKKKEQDKKAHEDAAATAMAVDDKSTETKAAEPEPDFAVLANPARVVRQQLAKISFDSTARFQPVRATGLRTGVVVVVDQTPGEPTEYVALTTVAGTTAKSTATSAVDPAEPAMPLPFDFDESIDE